jgi:pimeloyl-ACP methyl ester carboxylesterase
MGGIRIRVADLRGVQRLANDATVGITDLVEAMHSAILRTPGVLARRGDGTTRGITGLVYRSVRAVTRGVGRSADTLFDVAERYVEDGPSSPWREEVLAALNGIFGDYLSNTGNPLAIPMTLRTGGASISFSKDALAKTFPAPASKLIVLVHGLCMNDLQWMRNGHDHGASLAKDCGFTPLYLHYNTGRHICENGRDFSAAMEMLVREWPHAIEQMAMLGHSMGGLVIRSGCHYASIAGHGWLERLKRIVFLGTPHLGAPLERAGALADLLLQISPYSAPFARLGMARSAGIRDLGHGYLRDEDFQANGHGGRRAEPLPLPLGPRCCAIAASRQKRPELAGGRIRGDGLVPVASALGRSADALHDLGLAEDQCWIGHDMGHFDLLDRREVYERIRDWLDAG